MKPLLLAVVAAICFGCNSGKKEPVTPPPGDTTLTTGPKDSLPPTGPPAGKIDIESFGEIKLGQPYKDLLKVLGEPDGKSEPREWAADGLMHADWTWKASGLSLGMSWDKASEETTKTVFSITATPPCDFRTRAGMGIGSIYAEVQEAYQLDIDPEATDKTQITVGSIYGGIIFSFENNKVSRIFLGAEAE